MTHPELDDLQQYQATVKNQVRYYVLTYRFWVILGLILAVAGGVTIALTIKGPAWVQHSAFGPTATNYIGGLTGFVPFVAILTGAIFWGTPSQPTSGRRRVTTCWRCRSVERPSWRAATPRRS